MFVELYIKQYVIIIMVQGSEKINSSDGAYIIIIVYKIKKIMK